MRDASDRSSSLIASAVTRILEDSNVATLVTLIQAARNVGAKLLISESGERVGSLGAHPLDEIIASYAPVFLASRHEAKTFKVAELAPPPTEWAEALVLFERLAPEPRLVICGAGHVGAVLAQLARLTGYRPILIDDRADFVTRERFPDEGIELVAARTWSEALYRVIGKGRGVSVAVVTRGHNEDEECMRAAIGSDADYIGLIGSRRRTNIVLERLREAGVEEEKLARVRAPIGLDIGAVSPEEVALSILAEIVAERRSGSGAPLSNWRRQPK
jgi:xanthine dehydrogenase accessory factor